MRVSLNQLRGVIIQKDALPKSVFYFKNFIMLAVSTARRSCDVQGDPDWGNYALRFLLSPDKEPTFQASSEKRFRIQTSSTFFHHLFIVIAVLQFVARRFNLQHCQRSPIDLCTVG